jgi:hypothetical protein
MAAAPQYRGGLLTRRRLLAAFAALAAAAAAAWIFQAGLLASAARKYSGGVLSVSASEGTVLKGFTLTGLSFKSGETTFAAERIFIRPDLAALLRGRPAIAELYITSPSVILAAAPGATETADTGLPGWLPEISSAAITGGSLRLPGELPPVELITCSFSFSKGLLRSDSCSASAEGATVGLRGTWDGKAGQAEGRARYAPEDLSVGFKYGFKDTKHALTAAGAWGPVPFELKAGTAGEAWELDLSAQGRLPLNRIKPDLRELKLRSARLSAAGSGFSPGSAAGSGRFSAGAGIATASGTFTFDNGTYAGAVTLSSGPLSAAVSARLAGGELSGGWEVSSAEELLLPAADGFSLGAFLSSGTFSGTARAPAVKGSAGVSGFRSARLSGGAAGLDFEAVAGGDKVFRFTLAARNVAAGGARADSLTVSAAGTPARHSFSGGLSYGDSAFAVSGAGSLSANAWTGRVTDAGLPEYGWSLCGPFSVQASADGEGAVDGLCLASGRSRLRLSAGFEEGALTALQAAAEELELSWLEQLGFTSLRPEGVLNAEAVYGAGSPGSFKLTANDLKLNGLEMGEAAASGSFRPGAVLLQKGEWRLYGGRVSVSGSAGRDDGGFSAAFSLEASTANVAPLLAFFPGIEAREAWFSGASSVTLGGGQLNTAGALYLSFPRLTLAASGLVLDNVAAELSAGDISSARLRASAYRKGGRVSAEGLVSAAGPEIRITGAGLPFNHLSGLSGKASAQMLLSGSWEQAALTGSLELRETRFEMKQWEKYKPEEGRSAFYEAMRMNLRVKADKNAWYREGASSVEIKGDLFLKKEPFQPLSLMGTVEAVRGHYIYLGNTFVVNSGLITFSGEYPADPSIAAEASMEEHGAPYKVYFSASGTMRTPKILLSSDPSMEQRDIISYLVTGKPLYELYAPAKNGARAGRDDRTAQNLAAGYLSQQASATVGRKLSLDVVNLKMTGNSQADITVGRYVTKDLFISYGQVLGPGGEKRVSAEYAVTRHLSLEGKNTGDGRYTTDLLFKFGIR